MTRKAPVPNAPLYEQIDRLVADGMVRAAAVRSVAEQHGKMPPSLLSAYLQHTRRLTPRGTEPAAAASRRARPPIVPEDLQAVLDRIEARRSAAQQAVQALLAELPPLLAWIDRRQHDVTRDEAALQQLEQDALRAALAAVERVFDQAVKKP